MNKDLLGNIMRRIHKEQQLLFIKRSIIYFVGLVGSMAAFIPTFRMIKTGFVESGFIQFFSLLFSDLNIVMAHWQNFSLALLESLPVMNIIVFAIVIVVFLESLKFLAKEMELVFHQRKLINN